MNLDQVYDELYGAIDENLRSDTTLAGRVGTLETKMTAAEGYISDLEALVPEVPGRQLKLVDLGTEYTEELQEDISTGTFEKALVGGYLTINSHVYLFAHADYFLNTGDTACEDHHMVVIPQNVLVFGQMNLTATAAGGYAGSDMRIGHEDTTDPQDPVHVDGALQAIIDIIETDFGSSNILVHRENFTNGITGNAASGSAYMDSYIEILSENMAYGRNITGSGILYETGVAVGQLQLFAQRPDLLSLRHGYWLRDVASSTSFGVFTDYSRPYTSAANTSYGIRPYFCLK